MNISQDVQLPVRNLAKILTENLVTAILAVQNVVNVFQDTYEEKKGVLV